MNKIKNATDRKKYNDYMREYMYHRYNPKHKRYHRYKSKQPVAIDDEVRKGKVGKICLNCGIDVSKKYKNGKLRRGFCMNCYRKITGKSKPARAGKRIESNGQQRCPVCNNFVIQKNSGAGRLKTYCSRACFLKSYNKLQPQEKEKVKTFAQYMREENKSLAEQEFANATNPKFANIAQLAKDKPAPLPKIPQISRVNKGDRIKCLYCGNDFIAKRSTSRFCSNKCKCSWRYHNFYSVKAENSREDSNTKTVLENPSCIYCGGKTYKNGINKKGGKRRYVCLICRKKFGENVANVANVARLDMANVGHSINGNAPTSPPVKPLVENFEVLTEENKPLHGKRSILSNPLCYKCQKHVLKNGISKLGKQQYKCPRCKLRFIK